MIKGISFLRSAGNAAVSDRLASFFSALGFASGKGWQEAGHTNDGDLSLGAAPASRGVSFLAPLGNLEFVDGQFTATADVLVEVTALDAVHQAAEVWLRAQGGDEAAGRLSPVTETHWKSRIFTVEPEPGFGFSFWAWTDPIKGKPVAVEGDLCAEGMKFAIVVARWNAVITERLLEGALDALLRSGAKRSDVEVVRVPGAWEIPAAARTLANLGRVDAIVTLGCLLRGETAHYEAGNKGFEAAAAAIEMVSLRRKLEQGRGPQGQVSVRGVEGGTV